MKLTGVTALFLLVIIIAFSGCIQVTINVPALPGTQTPVISPTATPATDDNLPSAAMTTGPASSAGATSVSSPSKFIVPVGDLNRVGHRTFTFNYAPGGYAREYTIRVPVNMSVYYGAQKTMVDLPANSADPAKIQEYIESYGKDPSMDELYDAVLSQLRNARYQNGGYLDDDQYLEMIVAFVQQIPNVENGSPDRKYPIEVIYDKAGDSDEKSQLLAKLLAREGYDVSLMVFEDVGLEVVGIRVHEEVPDSNIKVFSDGHRDYVYVDVLNKGFIGNTPANLKAEEDLGIYPVGNGTKGYGQINYNWKIITDLNRMVDLGKITKNSVTINYWDRLGTCKWIKNSKLLMNTTCYCCDV